MKSSSSSTHSTAIGASRRSRGSVSLDPETCTDRQRLARPTGPHHASAPRELPTARGIDETARPPRPPICCGAAISPPGVPNCRQRFRASLDAGRPPVRPMPSSRVQRPPQGPGRLARPPRPPADRPRDRQPALAASFRPRPGGHPQRLRHDGRRAVAPELLDWLATELIGRGWSLKAMHRLIVTSATYRQSSVADRDGLAADPDNLLFSPRTAGGWTARRSATRSFGRGLAQSGHEGPSVFPSCRAS